MTKHKVLYPHNNVKWVLEIKSFSALTSSEKSDCHEVHLEIRSTRRFARVGGDYYGILLDQQ